MKVEIDYEFVERNWKRFPIPALASKFKLSPLEFMYLIRRKNICCDIQPFEIDFIFNNLNNIHIATTSQSKVVQYSTFENQFGIHSEQKIELSSAMGEVIALGSLLIQF